MGSDGIFDNLTNEEISKCVWLSQSFDYFNYTLNNNNFNLNNNNNELFNLFNKITGESNDMILKASMLKKSFDNVTSILITFNNLENAFKENINNYIKQLKSSNFNNLNLDNNNSNKTNCQDNLLSKKVSFKLYNINSKTPCSLYNRYSNTTKFKDSGIMTCMNAESSFKDLSNSDVKFSKTFNSFKDFNYNTKNNMLNNSNSNNIDKSLNKDNSINNNTRNNSIKKKEIDRVKIKDGIQILNKIDKIKIKNIYNNNNSIMNTVNFNKSKVIKQENIHCNTTKNNKNNLLYKKTFTSSVKK